jgi:hypothetical protein
LANKKLQDRKKKKKERETKTKLQRRRLAEQREKKKEKQINKIVKLTEPKLKPITREAVAVNKDEQIMQKLSHNMEILQALEDEYNKEMEAKKVLNEKLEDEGCVTIKEKFDSLEQKAIKKLSEKEFG